MTFLNLYRLSFYGMLFLSTLILCVEHAADNVAARLLPAAVAIVAVLAYLTVDRNPKYGLSLGTATLMSWVAVFLCYIEIRANPDDLVQALAHWLVYMQLIKMFRPKTHEDDWYLCLLGLVQVVVGAVLSRGGDAIGAWIVLWGLWSLWTLGLFFLYRAGTRPIGTSSAEKATTRLPQLAPRPRHRELYRGLFDTAFVLVSLRVALTTLFLGGLIFLLMPRASSQGALSWSQGGRAATTGFNEEKIKVGQIGEILENDDLVFTATLSDQDQKRLGPNDVEELLWRGTTMSHYGNGAWTRRDRGEGEQIFTPTSVAREAALAKSEGRWPTRWIRQTIELERPPRESRFALAPILSFETSSNQDDLILDQNDGRLFVDERGKVKEYTVVSGADRDIPSYLDQAAPSRGGSERMGFPPNPEYVNGLRSIHPDLDRELNSLIDPIVANISNNEVALASALQSYLQDPSRFSYSLTMVRERSDLDPILDFLKHHRQGNCEYFAGALTLMLRAKRIPARLVIGFKGGDWDGYNGVFNVREKHAHSWTEAFVRGPDGRHFWMTLDPTPSAPRDESVARVGGQSPSMRELFDAIRRIWVFYIQGMNAERQQRLIYGPLRELANDASRGFKMIRDALKALFYFPDLKSFFHFRGFVVSFLVLTTLALAYRVGRWLIRRILRWLRPGFAGRNSARDDEAACYRRLMKLLAERGLERTDSETPREFAQRATIALASRLWNSPSVRDVPSLVIESFYRVRFGQSALTSEETKSLEERVDALEAALSSNVAVAA